MQVGWLTLSLVAAAAERYESILGSFHSTAEKKMSKAIDTTQNDLSRMLQVSCRSAGIQAALQYACPTSALTFLPCGRRCVSTELLQARLRKTAQ